MKERQRGEAQALHAFMRVTVWGLAFSGTNYYCAVVICKDGALSKNSFGARATGTTISLPYSLLVIQTSAILAGCIWMYLTQLAKCMDPHHRPELWKGGS